MGPFIISQSAHEHAPLLLTISALTGEHANFHKQTMLNIVLTVHFVLPEAKGCTFTPPGCHHQRQHELHGPHDGDDVIATGAKRPPSHALAPAPAPASSAPRVPAPRPSPPQSGPRAGRTPPPPGAQPPSQLPQSPPPWRAPAPDLAAPSDALLVTCKPDHFSPALGPKLSVSATGSITH